MLGVVFALYRSPPVGVQSAVTAIGAAVEQALFAACATRLLCNSDNTMNKRKTRTGKDLLIRLRLEIGFISKHGLVAIAIGFGAFMDTINKYHMWESKRGRLSKNYRQ